MYTDIVEIIKSWSTIVQFIFFSIVVFAILAIVGMIVHSLAEFFNKTLIELVNNRQSNKIQKTKIFKSYD
jgi:hypothetical protein